jgi:electron-transferring-flavoprotein dehydrogenase
MTRESIDFDVLVVGGGPAGLSGALRLMQLAKLKGTEIEVAVIEKGAEIGAHAVSGAVMNPVALRELVPDYETKGFPLEKIVRDDSFYFLIKKNSYLIPFTPRYLNNKGFPIISLSKYTRWLSVLAEESGVNIFPGFAGKEVLLETDHKKIIGVRTGDKGLGKDGTPKGNFEPGMDLKAKMTIFSEGARGNLFNDIEKKFGLSMERMPQVYETGIKEVIELPKPYHFSNCKGNVLHFFGHPLGLKTPGGGFIYEMNNNRIALGFLIGLAYDDPGFNPYEEFIRFKQHPFVKNIISGGKVIELGARTVSTGGYFTIPQLAMEGGIFAGNSMAIHYSPGLKGIHSSMKSGMLAAETVMKALEDHLSEKEIIDEYQGAINNSWLKNELHEGRNFTQALNKKGLKKFFHLGAQYVTKGRGLYPKMPLEPDYKTFLPIAGKSKPENELDKKSFDGVLLVDKLTGVYLSKTMHREDQPSHIIVHDMNLCVNDCFINYKNPCVRFCPGNVYEIEGGETKEKMKLKLNPSNCLHCKTCEIKDPYENITWTCPEGGEGPGYTIL